MIISGKILLTIDRLFWLPFRVAEFILHRFDKIHKKNNGRYVVIKFMGIGSITQFADLCDRNLVDKTKIVLFTLSANRELCNLLGFENTVYFQSKNIFSFVRDCIKGLFYVRTSRPAIIIDFERCTYSVGLYRIALCLFARCRSISFGLNSGITTSFHTVFDVQKLNQDKLFLKGIDLIPKVSSIRKTKEKETQSNKVIININASNYLLMRRYSTDSFSDLITTLHLKNTTLEFYLTGTFSEAEYVDSLLKKLNGITVYNVCGKWSLEELTSQLSTCALFVTGDSGPMHLAAFLKVPTIIVWGPTQPEHFGYESFDHLHHISLKMPCSPCMKHPGSNPGYACNGRIDCLKKLKPAVIAEKAGELLFSVPRFRTVNTFNQTTAEVS